MTGKSQSELRTAAPMVVCSSHTQMEFSKCMVCPVGPTSDSSHRAQTNVRQSPAGGADEIGVDVVFTAIFVPDDMRHAARCQGETEKVDMKAERRLARARICTAWDTS